jgi:peroxiredoxin
MEMIAAPKPAAGAQMPVVRTAKVGGGGLTIGSSDGWQMLVVYRGRHCPLCRRYLAELNRLLDEYHSIGMEVVVVSADPQEKAERQATEEAWRFPVGYDLTINQMRLLGLYISEPRSKAETDRAFAEPGLFIVNPKGQLQIIDVSNAPSSTIRRLCYAQDQTAFRLRRLRLRWMITSAATALRSFS